MYKQVIVIRKDLKLSKGKLAVSVAHASLDAYKKSNKKLRVQWEREGSKKVVVKIEDLSKLLELYKHALKFNLPCSVIKDAGKTELKPGTITALGIGPCEDKKIDKLTGKLKIL